MPWGGGSINSSAKAPEKKYKKIADEVSFAEFVRSELPNKTLVLKDYELTTNDINTLNGALQGNSGVRCLRFDDCRILNKDTLKIITSLQDNRYLQKLDIDNLSSAGLPDVVYVELSKMLSKNSILTEVVLPDGSMFDSSAVKEARKAIDLALRRNAEIRVARELLDNPDPDIQDYFSAYLHSQEAHKLSPNDATKQLCDECTAKRASAIAQMETVNRAAEIASDVTSPADEMKRDTATRSAFVAFCSRGENIFNSIAKTAPAKEHVTPLVPLNRGPN